MWLHEIKFLYTLYNCIPNTHYITLHYKTMVIKQTVSVNFKRCLPTMPISFSMPTSIKELPNLASTFFLVPLDCTNVMETLKDTLKLPYKQQGILN